MKPPMFATRDNKVVPTKSEGVGIRHRIMNLHRVIRGLLMLSGWIALQTIGAASAQASCGDYLVGKHHSQSAVPVAHDFPDFPGIDSEQGSPRMPQPIPPCNGPNCQKSPTTPIAPVPTTINLLEHDQLGCLSIAITLQKSDAAVPLPSEQFHRSIGHPSSIDHPPRT